ncbi:MAG: hypothetical protein KME10_25160 [Plectolyngbya sp. WJT66-NPBG17]|nr:hypothetical protein [Plectolyngbya sp. WJT66-NPBG17]
MPSFSTFRRILQQVDAQGWVDSFNVWALTHAPDLAGQRQQLPRQVGRSVHDGKSIRCIGATLEPSHPA